MKTIRIGLFYTSDVHSHIYPYRYADLQSSSTGLTRVATCIEQVKQTFDANIIIDNGDLIQGAANSYYDAKISEQPTYPSVLAMNHIGCQAAIIGNHEFNYGSAYLRGAVQTSQFPWLSANILNVETGEPYFGKPYLICDIVKGLRVAILGLTTKFIPNWEHPRNIEGLAFADPVETAKVWVPKLRLEERADVVVVAYHGGLECDVETGTPIEPLTGENQGYQMLREISGIDVLLTGHQHREVVANYGGTLVMQPGTEGRNVGLVVLNVEQTSDSEFVLKELSGELISTADYVSDDRIPQIIGVAENEQATQSWLDNAIGFVQGNLRIDSVAKARQMDHPFVEFINHVQMWASGAPISAAALLDEDSMGFGESISMRDVISNYKYPNTLRVLRVSGLVLREAVEKSAAYFSVEDNEGQIGVNRDFLYPKPQHYNYDMWEGIEYEIHIHSPIGDRVKSLRYQGKPVTDKDSFDVVLNNYRAAGGGNFDMFKGCPVVKEIEVDMSELIVNYLRHAGTIQATCDNNWRIVE